MSDTTAAGSTATADGPARVSTAGPGGEIRVVEFVQARILDEANITEIGQQVTGLIAADPKPRVLLDFANVDHLSSAALGMLINANQRVREKNGELRLCGIKRQILEVFAITKLDKLFKIYPDRPAALASFGVARTDVQNG